MKEFLSRLRQTMLMDFEQKNAILVDTCFLIDVFDKSHQAKFEEFCEIHNVVLTSFNAEELSYNIHRIHEKAKEHLKKFLKKSNITLLNISLSPGSSVQERAYVEMIDPELLEKVHDPSDAVLVATAIRIQANILTKDKHHLFTTQLENFLNKYSIKVYKELKDVE